MRLAAAVLLSMVMLFGAKPSAAHGVEVVPRGDGQIVLRLVGADGAPLASSALQVFAPGSDRPQWSGASDRDGEVRFPAAGDGAWRLDVTAADGHVDRVVVRLDHGLPVTGGRLPQWLLAISLTGNIVAALALAGPHLRGRLGGK